MQNPPKSNQLIARIRENADAKENIGKAQIARKARYAADSMEKCFGRGRDVALEDVDKAWLDEYLHYLQREGKTDNTISNYFRVILSTLRSAVKEGATLDLTLLDGYFTGNSKSTRMILSVEEVKRIIQGDLKYTVFNRTRDVFSLCFFGGGLRIEDLQPATIQASIRSRLNATAEAKGILQQYVQSELLSFLGQELRQAYNHNLSGVAHRLNIKAPLDDNTAAEVWAEVAKSLGIPHDVISSVIGRPIDNLNYAGDATAGAEEIEQALARVARSIGLTEPHWYAIRCYEDQPEITAAKIQGLPSLKSPELKHFCLEDEQTANRKVTLQKNYLTSILFVHCLEVDIRAIRRALAPAIYVFDYRCEQEKRPAVISEGEMKTFMYLAGLNSASMMYYFPEEIDAIPSYAEYEEVTITQGLFAGVKARVLKKSKEQLNVIVRFEQANICYTVDIPCSLLSPIRTVE